jgi:hypothetical protein
MKGQSFLRRPGPIKGCRANDDDDDDDDDDDETTWCPIDIILLYLLTAIGLTPSGSSISQKSTVSVLNSLNFSLF